MIDRTVEIPAGDVRLEGELIIPTDAGGVVVFRTWLGKQSAQSAQSTCRRADHGSRSRHCFLIWATEMGQRGEWNVGQLMRQKFPDVVFGVGFTTHTGTVTATSNWDEPAQLKRFRPKLPQQFDGVIHFDETRAVEPLDKVASWTHEDVPKTFPAGV